MNPRELAEARDRAARAMLDPANQDAIDRHRARRLGRELEPPPTPPGSGVPALDAELADTLEAERARRGDRPPAPAGEAPTEAELAELALEMVEARRLSGSRYYRDPWRCPWCGRPTHGGPCGAHRSLEAGYQQARRGKVDSPGDEQP